MIAVVKQHKHWMAGRAAWRLNLGYPRWTPAWDLDIHPGLSTGVVVFTLILNLTPSQGITLGQGVSRGCQGQLCLNRSQTASAREKACPAQAGQHLGLEVPEQSDY